jgi:hypothetical protein
MGSEAQRVGRLLNQCRVPHPYQDSPHPSPGSPGPLTITRDAAVLLALLLRVELVAIALATAIGEEDALPLDSIECPKLNRASTGALDYGEIAGSCGWREAQSISNLRHC